MLERMFIKKHALLNIILLQSLMGEIVKRARNYKM